MNDIEEFLNKEVVENSNIFNRLKRKFRSKRLCDFTVSCIDKYSKIKTDEIFDINDKPRKIGEGYRSDIKNKLSRISLSVGFKPIRIPTMVILASATHSADYSSWLLDFQDWLRYTHKIESFIRPVHEADWDGEKWENQRNYKYEYWIHKRHTSEAIKYESFSSFIECLEHCVLTAIDEIEII